MVEKPVHAILQVRMGSTRLQGKTLKKLEGESVLYHVVTRIRRAKYLAGIIVATTDRAADDAVEAECERIGAKCFRGDEEDVLGRFYNAACFYGAKHIMRICGDNPLIDPGLLDRLIRLYEDGDYDYVRHQGTPVGLATEIFPFEALQEANMRATEQFQREHVTPYIYSNAVCKGELEMRPDCSHLRFTLDTEEDLEFIRRVYSMLYPSCACFGLDDILRCISQNPDLISINRHIQQKKI